MRLLPGQPADIVGESISSYQLTRHLVNDADVLPRVYQAFADEEYSPISAILAEHGHMTRGLREGTWNSKFRTVGSNHIMYPIASSQKRKSHFGRNSSGLTFYSPTYSTRPGYRGTMFYIYLDNNWPRPKEVIELNDNKTQLYILDEPTEFDDVYRYEVKIYGNDIDAYVDVDLMIEGAEVGCGMTSYEHDFSETGSEKYVFDGWGHSYMTLQRVKMSWSGTAAAMSTSKNWYQFKNSAGSKVYTFIDHAEQVMLQRAAQYHEYQLVFGRSTVTTDGKVFLSDKNGREIMGGSGLLYGGDGAVERPLTSQGLTLKFIESLLMDVELRSGKDGKKRVMVAAGLNFILDFYRLMRDSGFVTYNNNVVGEGENKGVNLDYDYFTLGGVQLIPRKYGWFTSQSRPQKYLSNGQARGGWDAVVFPMGLNTEGDNLVELVQLRPPVMGTINGMNKGGEDMASSVDGASKHYLWQTGVISRTTCYRIFMPYGA